MTEPLSILYAAPGNDLAPETGPSRKVLEIAARMALSARVTVAFRRAPEGAADLARARGFSLEEIDPGTAASPDGIALRGLAPLAHIRYLRRLRAFGRDARARFDALVEEGSRVSGIAGAAFASRGRPFVAAESFRPAPPPLGGPLGGVRLLGHVCFEGLCRASLGRATLAIAETHSCARELVRGGFAAPARIRLVRNAIDRQRFRPGEQAPARDALEIPPDATVLLYVGALDAYHDLRPLVRALGAEGPLAPSGSAPRRVTLHVVGEGQERTALESLARERRSPVVFHGRLPYDRVPALMHAADLCVAPYRSQAFPRREVTFSTIKVPEYLASGRAVATVPRGGPAEWVLEGRTGFLLENSPAAWRRLLRALPSRERLAEMGRAAALTEIPGWDETGRAFLAVVREALDMVRRNPNPTRR